MPGFPRVEELEFKSGNGVVRGLLYRAEGDKQPGLLILRGGQNRPNQESDNPDWQRSLASHGIHSISIDFRGVGESSGELAETGLESRLIDATAAAKVLQEHCRPADLYIAGVSMGAPIAIRLANRIGAKGVILISPAAYSDEAWTKNFGPEFSAALKKPSSWTNSPDFKALRDFPGKVLVAYGKHDEIIPEKVLQKYTEIAQSKGRVLALSDVGHSFIRLEDPASMAARDEMRQAVEKFLAR